jgi:hypothetical protein
MDLNGRVLVEQKSGLKKKGVHAEIIDISSLQSGNYMYVITTDGTFFGTGKLIKL